MRNLIRVLSWLIFALTPLALAGGGDASASSRSGRFIVTFQPASSAWAKAYREKMIKENIIPSVLQAVASEVRLPKDIPVTFKDCGVANAFWNRATNEMLFCYELIETMYDIYPDQAAGSLLLKSAGHNVVLG